MFTYLLYEELRPAHSIHSRCTSPCRNSWGYFQLISPSVPRCLLMAAQLSGMSATSPSCASSANLLRVRCKSVLSWVLLVLSREDKRRRKIIKVLETVNPGLHAILQLLWSVVLLQLSRFWPCSPKWRKKLGPFLLYSFFHPVCLKYIKDLLTKIQTGMYICKYINMLSETRRSSF